MASLTLQYESILKSPSGKDFLLLSIIIGTPLQLVTTTIWMIVSCCANGCDCALLGIVMMVLSVVNLIGAIGGQFYGLINLQWSVMIYEHVLTSL